MDLGGGTEAKIQLFQNKVLLHIKLNGIMNAAAWYQIFCPETPPPHTLDGTVEGQNSTFSE